MYARREALSRNARNAELEALIRALLLSGKEKLGVPQNENVSLVLESDGTQVEDGEYFKTLGNNTILLLLRHGERWCPTGVDIIRAGTLISDRTRRSLLGEFGNLVDGYIKALERRTDDEGIGRTLGTLAHRRS